METPAAVSVPRAPDTPSLPASSRTGRCGKGQCKHRRCWGWRHPRKPRPTPVGGSSSVARRAVRRAAVDMSTATTTAACTRARAARAHHTLKLGPRIYGPRRCLYLCPGGLCFPDPTSAGGSFPPSRAGGFLRRERPVVEERRRARAACDLEGNRAGLGCLEHLGNALSFAVVTEWPVRVYPRHRCRSPPQACLVRAVGQSSPCECMSGQNKD